MRAEDLLNPIVKILGQHTGCSPRVGVPYEIVMRKSLVEIGAVRPKTTFDKLPASYCKLVAHVFRINRASLGCLFVFVDGPRGLWGLTDKGVCRAKSILEEECCLAGEKEAEELLGSSLEKNRDAPTWVAIELSALGQMKIEEGSLDHIVRRSLGVDPDHGVFVPAAQFRRREKVVTIHLMEGYVFVETGMDEVKYFALERTPYVNRVMSIKSANGMRSLSVIKDVHVRRMRQQLRELLALEICDGDSVKIVEGLYSPLWGTVLSLSDNGESASVLIQLRSREIITNLPKVFLEVHEGEW